MLVANRKINVQGKIYLPGDALSVRIHRSKIANLLKRGLIADVPDQGAAKSAPVPEPLAEDPVVEEVVDMPVPKKKKATRKKRATPNRVPGEFEDPDID